MIVVNATIIFINFLSEGDPMALVFEVTVNPKSGRLAWVLDKTGRLKCYLKSEPEKNRANKELISSLSDALNIPQGDIEIIRGHTERKKTIKIHKKDMTIEILLEQLGLHKQESFIK